MNNHKGGIHYSGKGLWCCRQIEGKDGELEDLPFICKTEETVTGVMDRDVVISIQQLKLTV